MLTVTWIGHSTVLFEAGGTRLLTDPMLRGRASMLQRVAEPARPDAVAAIDAVLISHLHHDHLDIRSLRRMDRATRVIVPVGGGPLLRRRGFPNVTEVAVGDEVEVGAFSARATFAEHDGRRTRLLTRGPALGYVLTGPARTYFAGDTDLFEEMRTIAPELDLALLPVGGWGPRLPPGHLDPRSAAEALALLRPRVAVPIHWGTYRRVGLAHEPALLEAPAREFAELAAERAPEVEVRVLPVGGRLELDNELEVVT